MEITVLAVTRIVDGVCVAGVTSDGRWIRPTRDRGEDWRYVDRRDCMDSKGVWVVQKGNVVDMDVGEPIPKEFHTEDRLLGQSAPKLVRKLSDQEYWRTACRLVERNPRRLFVTGQPRSLMMVQPEVISFDFKIETKRGTRKYLPRMSFKACDRAYSDVPVTDAEWRGYGRSVMERRGESCGMKAADVFGELQVRQCLLTLGRNDVNGTPYLLVIGVHLFPVRRFEMDFER